MGKKDDTMIQSTSKVSLFSLSSTFYNIKMETNNIDIDIDIDNINIKTIGMT